MLLILRHQILVFLQWVLIDLIVENTSVRIFQFRLVQHLCLILLLGLHLAPLLLHFFFRFQQVLLLLRWHCERVHMLRIDLILLVNSRLLMVLIPLLVCIERIVCYFSINRRISAETSSWVFSGTRLRLNCFVPFKAVISPVCNCWLVCSWNEVLQWLSHDAIAKMLHTANTIEDINATVMYAAPVICHTWRLFWRSLVVVRYLNIVYGYIISFGFW